MDKTFSWNNFSLNIASAVARWAGLNIIALEERVKYWTLLHLLDRRTSGKFRMSHDRPGFSPTLDKGFPWINFSDLAILKSPQDRLCSSKMGRTQLYCSGRGGKILYSAISFVVKCWKNEHKVEYWVTVYYPVFMG